MQEGGSVTKKPNLVAPWRPQERPTPMPGLTEATQVAEEGDSTRRVGKIPVKMARRQRRMGTQATVWTDRLLAALEYRVQGGQWMVQPLPCADGAVLTGTSLHQSVSTHEGGPLTGKPDAGNPPVRFGGRGGRRYGVLPYPDQQAPACTTVHLGHLACREWLPKIWPHLASWRSRG